MSKLGEEEGGETTGSTYSPNMWYQDGGPSPLWGLSQGTLRTETFLLV